MTRLSPSWARLCGTVAVLVVLSGCKKGNQAPPDALGTSLIFDSASPEAREALATPVDFRLTDANYAQWELAQQYLDALPRSALPAPSNGGGSAIDRAVARLESSPRARTAIERTGLSVRDFVLETIALAQATEAAETGRTMSTSPVSAENFQFVQRYRSRILRARAQARVARAQAESYYMQSDSVAQGSGEMNTEVRAQGLEHGAEMQNRDSTRTSEHTKQPDSLARDNNQRPMPTRDTVRDTIPSR
ncbi:MAG TPA: hypothetical protein VEK37_07215 [Gemmatimonadaceae bacterium]|nr:hypothetical protein [Gemmatimonadaceae bacterium]